MTLSFHNLREIRERLFGYSAEGVSRLSGIAPDRLARLETDAEDMSVFESESLALVYGVDADLLADVPIRITEQNVIGVLASSEEFREVGDTARFAIIRAARAARDIVSLRELLQEEQPALPPRLAVPRGNQQPWQQGREIAQRARQGLGLGLDPIPSVRDLIRERLPGVTLLYSPLGADGPAALSLAAAGFGPAVVLNLDGKNVNPAVRRFSLAHEICHLLVDWSETTPLAQLSGYLGDASPARMREQRANSFAARFLCPESVIGRLPKDDLAAVGVLVDTWGLHYTAARLYLQNTRNSSLPPTPPTHLRATGVEQWGEVEAPSGLSPFPLEAVPYERRTEVARLAAHAYSRRLIQRDAFAFLLGVTPVEEVERVLHFFSLDPPASDRVA